MMSIIILIHLLKKIRNYHHFLKFHLSFRAACINLGIRKNSEGSCLQRHFFASNIQASITLIHKIEVKGDRYKGGKAPLLRSRVARMLVYIAYRMFKTMLGDFLPSNTVNDQDLQKKNAYEYFHTIFHHPGLQGT
jgi:hypothetical protein